MQSYYMGVGGTNWGWLPDPDVYTSYDYGSAIRETGEIGTPADPNDIAGSKFGENKLINDFETSVAPLTQTGRRPRRRPTTRRSPPWPGPTRPTARSSSTSARPTPPPRPRRARTSRST